MSKLNPINENYLFRRLYGRGKSKADPVLVTYCLRNGKKENRVGITSSKKIGNAVLRNRARRVIREAYRLSEETFPKGFDFVFVARGKTTRVPMQVVMQAMQRQVTELTSQKNAVVPQKKQTPE